MVKLFNFTIGSTMGFILQPWQIFFILLTGWVNREQEKRLEFYELQLKAMMNAQRKKRLLLTDDQRRLVAVKGKSLGRNALMERTTIVTPDTILRWPSKTGGSRMGLQRPAKEEARSATHAKRGNSTTSLKEMVTQPTAA